MAEPFKPDFVDLCRLLNERGVQYLVIGGWAGILHGIPRTTLDVDLFIPQDRANTERLIAVLGSIGFGIAKELTPEIVLSRHVFQFADQIRVDLFTRPWGLNRFEESAARKVILEVGGVRIPVASLDDLAASKDTDRPQDQDDRRALLELKSRPPGSS